MKKKWLAVGIILLFFGVAIAPAVAQSTEKQISVSRGTWLYVGGSGPGNYTKIQDALDNASVGDTVYVFHGIYAENLSIEKQIHLVGENQINTTIDGDNYIAVSILGCLGVTLSNFTIRNQDGNGIGIKILSSENVTVFQNTIINTSCGISVESANFITISSNLIYGNLDFGIFVRRSHNNRFQANTICENENGLFLYYSDNNIIHANNVSLNNRSGIILTTDTSNNTITNNRITSQFLDGLSISYSGFNTVTGNIILDNRFGISLFNTRNNSFSQNILASNMRGFDIMDSNMNFIFDNEITSSSEGILLGNSDQNRIRNNTIAGNSRGITRLRSGGNNIIFHNDFIANKINAYEYNVSEILFWDNETEGNYWDDYTGFDTNHDGIGDQPYLISEIGSQDRYPLMSPHRMTRLAIIIQPHLFTVSLRIKNVGEITAFNVRWSIFVKKGLIFFGRNVSGDLLDPLPPGHEMNVTAHLFMFGLGRIEITYAAWAENAAMISETLHGVLLFIFFVKIMRK